jgi:hypothetical protein
VLRLERRIAHEGMISVGANHYLVPDGTRCRPVEVQVTAAEIHILKDGRLATAHSVLEGRGRRRIADGHRSLPPTHNSTTPRHPGIATSTRRGRRRCTPFAGHLRGHRQAPRRSGAGPMTAGPVAR